MLCLLTVTACRIGQLMLIPPALRCVIFIQARSSMFSRDRRPGQFNGGHWTSQWKREMVTSKSLRPRKAVWIETGESSAQLCETRKYLLGFFFLFSGLQSFGFGSVTLLSWTKSLVAKISVEWRVGILQKSCATSYFFIFCFLGDRLALNFF